MLSKKRREPLDVPPCSSQGDEIANRHNTIDGRGHLILSMASSSLASDGIGDEESVCYLCLDGDLDDDGRPLRRDCACRGTDAGFVHLSCLANYAETKSKGWDGRDMIELV